ncbi:MAG: hypothetical protein ACRCSX_13590, partial [Allorhizobium sp.]
MTRVIMIVLRSNCGMLEIASVVESFRYANELSRNRSYVLTTCAVGYQTLQSDEHWIRLSAVHSLANSPPEVDTLI